MKTARRSSCLVMAGSLLLAFAGCGGGVPPSGSQAALPPTYKAREKEISEAMEKAMKLQRASRGRPARGSEGQPAVTSGMKPQQQ